MADDLTPREAEVLHGLELMGSGASHLGGYSTGLRVYTDY